MLTAYANTLSWAQGQASEAIAQWQQGDAATQQAMTAHDRAVSDAQARTQANAEHGQPSCRRRRSQIPVRPNGRLHETP